jgi:predicted RNA-binding Zn-ribbon protein involved in translation (DUF1610 family)
MALINYLAVCFSVCRDEESTRRKRRKRSSSVSSSSSSSDSEAEKRKRKKRKEDKKKKKKRSKDTRKSKQRSPSVERSAEELSEAQLESTYSVEPVNSALAEPQVVAGERVTADTADAEAAAHSDAHAMAPPPPVIQAAAAAAAVVVPTAVAAEAAAAAPAPEPKVSKAAFFAKLQAVEARKEPVGTVHSKGKSVYTTSKTLKTAETSDKWECPKCGTEQNKHSTSCEKCHGLKRLSVWR